VRQPRTAACDVDRRRNLSRRRAALVAVRHRLTRRPDRATPAEASTRGQSRGHPADSAIVTPRLLAVLAIWIALIGAAAYQVYAYETAPGPAGPSPAVWPDDSSLVRAADGFTVVMFVHPSCVCTAASLSELEAALGGLATPPRVIVVFVGGADPRTSDHWAAAGRLPGVVRVHDDGAVMHRFGARTSGHVLVYDGHGALRFSGGLTGSRGHVGDNVGGRSVATVLRGGDAEPLHGVFGCSLEDGP
jgi:hypothetical protein